MSTTLWESLGGERVMAEVVNDFVDAVVADPRVNYTRDGRYPVDAEILASTKRRSLELLSHGLGGPLTYSGRSLQEIHAGMNITDEEFAAAGAQFQRALAKHAIPTALIDTVMQAVENVRPMIVARS